MFGCRVWSYFEKDQSSKFEPKAEECVLVGNGEGKNIKGYKLFYLTVNYEVNVDDLAEEETVNNDSQVYTELENRVEARDKNVEAAC